MSTTDPAHAPQPPNPDPPVEPIRRSRPAVPRDNLDIDDFEAEAQEERNPHALQARISRIAAQRREERRLRAEAEQELSTVRADTARRLAELERSRAEWQAKLTEAAEAAKAIETERATWTQTQQTWEAERASHAETLALVRAGVTDDEGAEFVRLAYQRVPADQRPAGGISEWLGNRDALPKAVQVYLPQAEQPPAPAPEPAKVPPKPGVRPAPNPNAGARGTPGAPPVYRAGDVMKMTDEEFAAAEATIMAQIGATSGTTTRRMPLPTPAKSSP